MKTSRLIITTGCDRGDHSGAVTDGTGVAPSTESLMALVRHLAVTAARKAFAEAKSSAMVITGSNFACDEDERTVDEPALQTEGQAHV